MGSMIVHAADIGTATKSSALSSVWTERLKQEFFQQGDQEKPLGIPVSPLCDRDNCRFAASQIGFIQYVVRPCYDLLAGVCPALEDSALKELSANEAYWAERKAEEGLELIAVTVDRADADT